LVEVVNNYFEKISEIYFLVVGEKSDLFSTSFFVKKQQATVGAGLGRI